MMIPTIPTPDEILDKGFSRGKKQADLLRSQKIPKHLKGKRIEERRVVTSCQVIKDKLKSILDAVPEIESMHPFYLTCFSKDISNLCCRNLIVFDFLNSFL